jgi:hypothetical protein
MTLSYRGVLVHKGWVCVGFAALRFGRADHVGAVD